MFRGMPLPHLIRFPIIKNRALMENKSESLRIQMWVVDLPMKWRFPLSSCPPWDFVVLEILKSFFSQLSGKFLEIFKGMLLGHSRVLHPIYLNCSWFPRIRCLELGPGDIYPNSKWRSHLVSCGSSSMDPANLQHHIWISRDYSISIVLPPTNATIFFHWGNAIITQYL